MAFLGGLIKNPWKPVVPTAEGMKAVLWTSGWTPRFQGETIFLARATGEWLVLLDHDDVLADSALSALRDHLDARPDAEHQQQTCGADHRSDDGRCGWALAMAQP